jgi:hypothetical protein
MGSNLHREPDRSVPSGKRPTNARWRETSSCRREGTRLCAKNGESAYAAPAALPYKALHCVAVRQGDDEKSS